MNFWRGLWPWYVNRLKTHPYSSNIATAMCIVSVGDVAAQYAERNVFARDSPPDTCPNSQPSTPTASTRPVATYRSDVYDFRRTLIIASFTFFGTPFWIAVYRGVDRAFRASPPSISKAMKQGFSTWVVSVLLNPVFTSYVAVTSGYLVHNVTSVHALWDIVVERLQRNFSTQTLLSLAFWGSNWPMTFYYLDPHLRLVYVTWLQLIWNGILSWILHRD